MKKWGKRGGSAQNRMKMGKWLGAAVACLSALALGPGNAQAANSGQKTIAILPPGMTSPFYVQIVQGARKIAQEYGYKVIVEAPPAESDFNTQVSMMENLVSEHVSAIAVCPMDDKAIGTAILQANKAHIPVFIFNGLASTGAGNVTEYIGYNQREAAHKLAQFTVQILHGRGNIMILDGIPSYYNTERVGGYKEIIKKYPNIHIVEEQQADWLRSEGLSITMQALQAHPNIKLVYGASDEMDIGAAIAASQMHKHIYTIGIDGNPVTLQDIQSGLVTATIGTFPYEMGETVVEQMHKYFMGQSIPKFLETPTVLVTKSNLQAYESGKLWTTPKASQEEVEM